MSNHLWGSLGIVVQKVNNLANFFLLFYFLESEFLFKSIPMAKPILFFMLGPEANLKEEYEIMDQNFSYHFLIFISRSGKHW